MGWGIPETAHGQFKRNVRPPGSVNRTGLFILPGSKIVGLRPLFSLSANASAISLTPPAFRCRASHSELLRYRLRDARTVGVDFVCSGSDFLSTSHRNGARRVATPVLRRYGRSRGQYRTAGVDRE
jgi:hypothetical protein